MKKSFLHLFWFAGLILSLPLQAQNLRLWMPNVEDSFVIVQVTTTTWYSHGRPVNGNQTGEFFGYRILAIDTTYEGSPHTVLATVNGDTTPFVYQLSSDSTALLPLIINQNDFSKGVPFFDSSHALTSVSVDTGGLTYSLRYHWFTSLGGGSYTPGGDPSEWSGEAQSWYSYLLSSFLASVSSPTIYTGFFISVENIESSLICEMNLKEFQHTKIELLDRIGRTIRSWQLPIDAGPREISLNVADVPNGIYFLSVSGGGIDEVKKVVIAH